jgi:hypothetical protein
MKFAAAMVLALALSGCGAGSTEPAATNATDGPPDGAAESASPGHTERTEPQESATPEMVASEECIEAFGEMLPELNSIEAMESRLPVLGTCSSLDEWVGAAAQHPQLVQTLVSGAWEEPTASLYLLGEACAFLDAAGGASLCEQLSAWCESSVENLSQVPCQVARPVTP